MQALDWEKIRSKYSTEPIEWRFNPPAGPWWGGFFERLIGLVKGLLRKNLGRASLSYTELYTLICECEALINARPITYTSDTNDGPIPISPLMFLQEIRCNGVPDLEEIDATSLDKRLRYRQTMKKELRDRFRSEYLSQLIFCEKKTRITREPVVGEVVLVCVDNIKRLGWPLAVVVELMTGKDGKCRVVKLRTAEGILIRPVQRIYPLEVFSPEEDGMGDIPVHSDGNEGSHVVPQSPSILEDDIDSYLDTVSEEEFRGFPDAPDVESPEQHAREVTTRCGRTVRLPLKFR
uniref:Chaperone protein ClpB n=1 Tax=Lygus hesperus TaxID=30085 RepID=A0A0A9WXX2_LYGHE